MSLVLHTATDPWSLAFSARRSIQAVDPEQPAVFVMSLNQVLADPAALPRFRTSLLKAFAALALILVASGMYGVMSYAFAQREHEIGIRMALGARPARVPALITGEGMLLASEARPKSDGR